MTVEMAFGEKTKCGYCYSTDVFELKDLMMASMNQEFTVYWCNYCGSYINLRTGFPGEAMPVADDRWKTLFMGWSNCGHKCRE